MEGDKIEIIIDTPIRGWSHMTSNDINSLHEFADKCGIKRHWFENKRGKNQPHYDVKEEMYDLMIEMGAKPVSRSELFVFLKENYGKD